MAERGGEDMEHRIAARRMASFYLLTMQRQDDGWRMACSADGDANPQLRSVGTLRRRRASEALSTVHGLLVGWKEMWQMAVAKRAGPSWTLVYAVTPFAAVPGPRYVAGHGHFLLMLKDGEGGP